MIYYDHFEIDIIRALSDQLVDSFGKLGVGGFLDSNLKAIPKKQGVYQLYKDGKLVYVGKASNLPNRLQDHLKKISGRKNISIDQMGFKCLSVHPNWTALAPEETLIRYYKSRNAGDCEWNGNSFGPHDPGRQREETNQSPQGFDAQYPIKDDWVCDWIEPGIYNGNELLRKLKESLPYLLRYQTQDSNNWRAGHPDYNAINITVSTRDTPARDLLREIACQLPGWQATVFYSHMILYKENRTYIYGTVL